MIGITGSNGFIGNYLKANFNIGDILEFEGDLLDKTKVEKFVQNCDSIIHLAGKFSNNFDELYESNVTTTRNLVDAVCRSNIHKFIFTSTGAIYGSASNPFKENDSPTPDTLYGLSKLYAELYIKFSDINYTILRFPNIYGPGSRKGVIYNFIEQIQRHKTINILGDGNQKRDFLHVHDACSAIVKVFEDTSKQEVFNVSNKNYSLNEVSEILSKLTDEQIEITHQASDENNKLMNLSLDITKINSKLNWTPKISLEKGLEELMLQLK